ncbi:MAG: hypothetical protein IPN64_00155 [Propionivibrio sp.]|uniref:hypothetical protein n=1 Tax=Propionivibrio sp. TaxID=2212460 RepID=UPI0025D361C9|nr:hypothetical protein [Propionivibrio sp.]MBK8892511.1 hypothetical protein [Propionivibrio sp.]
MESFWRSVSKSNGRVAVVRADDLTPAYAPDISGITGGNLASVAWSRDGRTLYAAGT